MYFKHRPKAVATQAVSLSLVMLSTGLKQWPHKQFQYHLICLSTAKAVATQAVS